MSVGNATRAAAARHRQAGPWASGRPMGGIGMPVQKAKNFKGTLLRLLGYFAPAALSAAGRVLAAAIIGTVFNVVGPKILGLATTKLFEGLRG